jgi:hypothetical protein
LILTTTGGVPPHENRDSWWTLKLKLYAYIAQNIHISIIRHVPLDIITSALYVYYICEYTGHECMPSTSYSRHARVVTAARSSRWRQTQNIGDGVHVLHEAPLCATVVSTRTLPPPPCFMNELEPYLPSFRIPTVAYTCGSI